MNLERKKFKLDAYGSYWVLFGPKTKAGKIKAAAAAVKDAAKVLKRAAPGSSPAPAGAGSRSSARASVQPSCVWA